jgi:uncharacterized damage-inducible protein DinB
MSELDEHGRPEPPGQGDETATLLGFLDYQRATLAWKCDGLDAAGLRAKLAPSALTLGGLLKHMALVEEQWFSVWLAGGEYGPPWDAIDWKATPDWEFETAADDPPEQLRAQWRAAVERSREVTARALAEDGPGQVAKRADSEGRSPSMRWILCHMVEEYSRHNGHADLIRESIDGLTGE